MEHENTVYRQAFTWQWEKLSVVSVYLTIACLLVVFWGNVTRNSLFIQLGTYGLYLACVPWGCVSIVRNMDRGISTRSVQWSAFLVLISGALSVVLAMFRAVNMGMIVDLLLYCMLPLYVASYRGAGHIKALKRAICIGNVFYCLFHVVLSFTSKAYVVYLENGLGRAGENLTLGYSNPNQTGMLLLGMLLILVVSIARASRKWVKAGGIALAAYMCYMIFRTNSRTCILMVVGMVLALTTSLYRKVNKKILFLAFLVPAVYVFMELFMGAVVANTTIMGETVATGRGNIFIEFLGNTDIWSILVGDFGQYGRTNLHNGYITVFARVGLVGLVPFIMMLWRGYGQCYQDACRGGKPEFLAFCSLVLILLHTTMEAAYLTGGTMYAGIICLLMLLTVPDDTEQTQADA